jgi:hypothetical protein
MRIQLSTKLVYGCSIGLLFLSCAPNSSETANELDEIPIFKCVVAGHAYGNPENYTKSLYPKFLEIMDSLTEHQPIDQLILTGDLVADTLPEIWDKVKTELEVLAVKDWKIARGNHDLSAYLDQNIQKENHLALHHGNSLLLILNTSNNGWGIDKVQSEFVEKSVAELPDSINQILVFTHQLWWLKNAPSAFDLDSIRPNSYALFDGEPDFWSTGFPALQQSKKQVYFFAGDLGVDSQIVSYYEDHYKNFHFYGSGMGSGKEDNLLLISIYQNQPVKIERINF